MSLIYCSLVLACTVSDFIVLCAGTIGVVSGAETVLDGVERRREEEDLKAALIGEGPLVDVLREGVEKRGPANVVCAPSQPREKLNQAYSMADVSVVTLRQRAERASVPRKLPGYMATARPIAAAVEPDGQTARPVATARAGLVVRAENAVAPANTVRTLKEDPERARRYSRSGRPYRKYHLPKDRVVARYVGALHDIGARKQ